MQGFATIPMWIGFFVFVLLMLALDLLMGGGRSRRITARAALLWSLFWFALSIAFAGLIWWYLERTAGAEVAQRKTLEYLAGYLIEKALALDNIFVFVMIFSFLRVPPELQRRVLVYGVLGAILMRTVMIFAGVWLISKFSWLLLVFGVLLLVTGVKMLMQGNQAPDLAKNPLLLWVRGHMRVTEQFHAEKFFVRLNGVRHATPLFLALVLVEFCDLVFAVDSIPAIFAVTNDPFLVLTSNIFAILGLRALYFLLADMNDRFHLLKYGLSLVLVFIGVKLMLSPWFHLPIEWSLGVVAVLIGASIGASLLTDSGRKSGSKS